MEMGTFERKFIVVGENIHATRVLHLGGQNITKIEGGQEAIRFHASNGEVRFLPIPETYKNTQEYQEGRVKHIKLAIQAAMSGQEPAAALGLEYLGQKVRQQLDAGADFIDLNVDEVSIRPEDQKAAMSWLVKMVQPICSVPLSIDSSNIETIETGLKACERPQGRPLLNSASLERKSALDLAVQYGAQVIVTAAGETGMPTNDAERVTNASRMVELACEKGIPLEALYIDALVFPISVDGDYGNHFLGAVRKLRERFGRKIHITGGFSNVSFGLPMRRLINNVMLILATEAGADCGIIDPVAGKADQVLRMDRQSRNYQVAADLLLGRDTGCRKFLRAYRSKELQTGVGAC